MTMNPLPPQAYTKDILVQAYAWLQNQSESVKEIATTPDVLVGLYLKAKMQGADFFERPSIQNFKNELKSLAGMIGEFEVLEPAQPPAQPVASPAPAFEPATNMQQQAQQQIPGNQSFRFRSQDLKAQQQATAPSALEQMSRDNRTEAMIQEVKLQFNLSSNDEALRLLVSAGFHQLKTLIK